MPSSQADKAIPPEWIPRLDLQWVALWNDHGAEKFRADEVSVEAYRRDPEAYSFTYPTWSGPTAYHEEELDVPVTRPSGFVRIRVYSPRGNGPFPVHLNTHGGGWVLGSLKSEAAWCRSVCDRLPIKVIDVDYRMAPEFPFPTAIYDFWEVLKWVRTNSTSLNIDPASLSIGGLSAGGHMTAVLSHMARDAAIPLKLALMVVPSTDLRSSIGSPQQKAEGRKRYPSIQEFAKAPWGGEGRLKWFMDHWIPDDKSGLRKAAYNDWMASPILASSFNNLPRTHIVTAEFDGSRDESHKYGEILKAHGNNVSMKCYMGVPHAFGHYNHPQRGLSQSHQYIVDTCEVLKDVHGLADRPKAQL